MEKKFTLRVPINLLKLTEQKLIYILIVKDVFFRSKVWNKRPHGTPLALNNKVVQKLKSELNICREEKKIHPQILEKT